MKDFHSTNPWNNCTSIGVDNTSVNIGVQNSLKSRILMRNNAVYVNGCPCHILHTTGQKAAKVFDVEEFAIDLFYWSDKSTKRKNKLQSYCEFCDQEYRAIIKHVSTHWLTLELAVEKSLKQFRSLKSYFLFENEAQTRFIRFIQNVFQNLRSEVYVCCSFNHSSPCLQRAEPLIHVLQPQLTLYNFHTYQVEFHCYP